MQKNLVVFTGLLCVALYCAAISFADDGMQSTVWKNVSTGIRDANVKTITVRTDNPDVAYAGTRSVVYHTMDKGKSWDEVLSFRGTDNAIFTIAADPLDMESVYAGTMNGLYTSSNRGQNWSRIYQSIRTPESYVLSVAVSPSNPSLIFIGTGQGVYRSDNGGKDWKRDRIIPKAIVSDVIIDRLNPDRIYASSSKGLYRSIDNGSNWKRLFVLSSKHEKAVDNEEVIDSKNDESDEHEIVAEIQSKNIAVDPLNSDIIYFGTEAGIYLSKDGGASWNALSSTGLRSKNIRNLSVNASYNDSLFAATDKGVFRYSPKKDSWESLYKGLSSTNINCVTSGPVFHSDNASLWAATAQGVFKTESVTQKTDPKVEGMSAQDILSMFDHEPRIEEIRETAIEYASVHPDKIEKWRKAAAKKAWLPRLSMNYGKGDDWQNSYSFYKVDGTYIKHDDITEGNDEGWAVSLAWDLSNLVWTTSQSTIELRSKSMVQLRDDVLNEVTRLYYERRRLQTEMITVPPENLTDRIEKELRLQELTAGIDSLTGSYMSKRLAVSGAIQ